MVADIENHSGWYEEDDNLIDVVVDNLRTHDLPFQRTAHHLVVLPIQGHWQDYSVVIMQDLKEGHASVECRMVLDDDISESTDGGTGGGTDGGTGGGTDESIEKTKALFALLNAMNANSRTGYYYADTQEKFVGFRLNVTEGLLPALDMFGIEDLIDRSVQATEALYPVCHALLHGKMSWKKALGKYIAQPQGHA